MPIHRLLRRPAGLVLAIVVAMVISCNRQPAEAPAPDVIVISLDTLRRDGVGAFQPSGGSQTPNLDGLASEMVLFDDAWAPVPFTLPSHMSIFTGLYPDVHRVDRKESRLGDGVPTLSILLQNAGYRTLGLVTNLWMKGDFGFDRGFDHYERLPYGLVYADRVNSRAFELIDSRPADDKPLFLFVHYIDPHSDFFKAGHNALPYYAPSVFLRPTGIAADSLEFCDADDNCATDFLLAANDDQRALSAETVARIVSLYDAGVAYLDWQVGILVDGLRARGLWDDALVVITSDHGEEFREHGLFIHIQPYVENLAIPLMIKLPGNRAAGTRIGATVETVDLLPTVLDVVGLEQLQVRQGESLLPIVGGASPMSAVAFGRDKLTRSRFSLRLGDHTLIHDVDSGATELYNRIEDPGEHADIAADHPEVVESMKRRLMELVEADRALAEVVAAGSSDTAVLSPEEAEKLRAIGYLE